MDGMRSHETHSCAHTSEGGLIRPSQGRPFAIKVAHVDVRRGRIVAEVVVSDERFARTTPRLVASLLPRYPHLLEHTCANDRGDTFAAVAHNTSTPHLLEHMAIENQVSRASGTYVGKTRWASRARLCACVELSYSDDLVALAALRDAAHDLNDALMGCAP